MLGVWTVTRVISTRERHKRRLIFSDLVFLWVVCWSKAGVHVLLPAASCETMERHNCFSYRRSSGFALTSMSAILLSPCVYSKDHEHHNTD